MLHFHIQMVIGNDDQDLNLKIHQQVCEKHTEWMINIIKSKYTKYNNHKLEKVNKKIKKRKLKLIGH